MLAGESHRPVLLRDRIECRLPWQTASGSWPPCPKHERLRSAIGKESVANSHPHFEAPRALVLRGFAIFQICFFPSLSFFFVHFRGRREHGLATTAPSIAPLVT